MSHYPPHRPAPGPDCPRYAPLLPLLDADELTTTEAAAVRRHIDGCPWCQWELADYLTVDMALHQHLSALMAEAPIQTEETIMRLADRDESDTVHLTDTTPEIKLNRAKMPARGQRVAAPPHTLMAGAAAVLVVGLLAATFVFFSHHSASPISTVGAPPTATATPLSTAARVAPYKAGADDVLGAIQMSPPYEGWAVGGYDVNAAQAGAYSCLVVQYMNGQWIRLATPTNAELGVDDASLQSVAMISPDEGWAVGAAGDFSVGNKNFGLILHYSGGKWTKYSLIPKAELWSVQMLTPTDGWAAGGGGWNSSGTGVPGPTASILLHYNGSHWTPVPVPNVTGITSLDMVSANDGWATGTNTILHYNGTQWSIFAELQGVSGVSMDSATDGWAFGYVNFPYNHTSSDNVVWHFTGSQWVRGTLPSTVDYNASILGMSMDSASDGWAVGYGNGQKYGNRYTLYLHYAHGQWTAVEGPGSDNLDAVAMLSANDGWAVGNGGVLMHYLNGTWTQYQP
jgi:anti-sigma factor RsiW